MILSENIKYSCKLNMEVYENDVLVKTIEKSNLFVNEGKKMVYESLLGNTNSYHISKVLFGTDINVASTIDTIANFGDIGYEPIELSSYSNDDTLFVDWRMRSGTFNGNILGCVGLTNLGVDRLFNRVVIDAGDRFYKTPLVVVYGRFTINVA